MVTLMGLTAAWPYVAGWVVAAIVTVGAEDALLRRMGRDGAPSRAARPPPLKILATTIYATAALVLIARAGQRLFAFALMSASMVHVLMRYYRSPVILIASMTPYIAIMALVGIRADAHPAEARACAFGAGADAPS